MLQAVATAYRVAPLVTLTCNPKRVVSHRSNPCPCPAKWRYSAGRRRRTACASLGLTMQLGLLLVCAALPFLEIALLIKVGEMIGFWLTLLIVLVSAGFGSYVIYEQGFQVMGRALDAMNRGKRPIAPVIDGVFILLGGLLLIMPGFISDAMGLVLLVPALRHRIAVWGLRRLIKSGSLRNFMSGGRPSETAQTTSGPHPFRSASPSPPSGEGPIIEGEFERLGERSMDRDHRRDQPPPT